jgi:hypothetical protein
MESTIEAKVGGDGMRTDVENGELRPCGFSQEQIAEFVSKIVEVIKPANGSIDPFDVVKTIRGRIHYSDPSLWAKNNCISKVESDGSFSIFLPNYASPLKNRFIVAHELGHYFLHAGVGEIHITFPITPADMRCEAEAECFARYLLAAQKPTVGSVGSKTAKHLVAQGV